MTEIPYGKKLIIKNQSNSEFEEESVERLEEALGGEDVPVTLSFENPEKIRKLLTEKRLDLMKTVMIEKPDSITELAEETGRDVKDVHKDLKLLEENKIVFFESNGRKKKPVIPYEDIKVDYSIKDTLIGDRGMEA